jgi:hypothetical protein
MMADVKHLRMEELEARLEEIGQSPRDEGVLDLIVRRPRSLERELLLEGELDLEVGLGCPPKIGPAEMGVSG